MEYFGHKGVVGNPADFFLENHYVLCRGASNPDAICRLFEVWNKDVVPSNRQYLRQNTKHETHQLTPAGGVKNALLNPHCYTRAQDRELSGALLEVLAEPGLSAALMEIGGKAGYRLFQTMMFDHSVTPPHQDWIYLDSRPNGHVIAAWIALEDIPAEAIRFFVYLGSQNFVPEERYAPSDTMEKYSWFIDEINRHLSENKFEMYAPSLKRGDVFFWSSRIVHGSVEGTNPNLRRRSVAAHFLPDGYGAGDLERDFTNLSELTHRDLRYISYQVDGDSMGSRIRRILRQR